MASQHILILNPPSKVVILNDFLENAREYNARQPRHYVGLRECVLDAEMPLLLNLPDAPLACHEPLDEFEAVNNHFSAQVHAFFNAIHDLEDMAAKQFQESANELTLIRQDDGLWLTIRTLKQSFDIYPDCMHRTFYTRRLIVQDPDSLPLLRRVTKLRVFPAPNYAAEPGMDACMVHLRPFSPCVPLELAARLPNLGELDCPWLCERFSIPFWSQAVRIYTRVWEGPWRDARVEFGRAVRRVMPILPSSFSKARLWFWSPDPFGDDMDQAAQMPDLVGPSTSVFGGRDPVSLGLRDLATRLEELDVRALITPDLFPSAHSSSWSRMRHLKIEFHPCAPDGRWYFSGPRGEDPYPAGFAITREGHYPPGSENPEETHELYCCEEDEYYGDDHFVCSARQPDMFRTRPIAERVNPLLLAFASFLRKDMPSLEDAELFTWLSWRPSEARAKEYEGSGDAPPSPSADGEIVMFRWGVRYDAPEGDGKGRLKWQVGDCRPGEEVMWVFEEFVGKENMKWEAFEFVTEKEQHPAVFI